LVSKHPNVTAIMQKVEQFSCIFRFYSVRIEPAGSKPKNRFTTDHYNIVLAVGYLQIRFGLLTFYLLRIRWQYFSIGREFFAI
jgi:hypothetical protein